MVRFGESNSKRKFYTNKICDANVDNIVTSKLVFEWIFK